MKISEEVIERIKQENDIVDIISESVRLKRSGRNFFGLCPFHNDKNPSFSVSQEKQIYKCFSCGEAGNVVTFVMKQKNLQYVEALKYLAEKANIPLDLKEGRVDSSVNRKKDILYKVNVETGRFFFKNLTYQSCILFYFIYSLGIGLIVGNTMTSAMSHLPKNLQADGNATLQTLMQLSGGIGTSITATILAFVQQGTNLYDGTNRGALFVLIFLMFNINIVILSQYFAFKGGKKNEF